MIKSISSNVFKFSFSALFISLLTACGGGGGDSAPAPTNTSSYPNVAGHYSLNTGTVGISCSDGSSGTNPALALNFDVTQNVNVITLVNSGAGSIPGFTILSSTDATGNVQTNSHFIVTQIATALITGISGEVVLNYNLTGTFTTGGWSGTYTYIGTSATLGSCTFTSTFTGDKIIAGKTSKPVNLAYEVEYLPVDFYDTFSVMGSSIATKQ